MKSWALKLHRWVALVAALPLVAVLGTGLVLSLEPLAIDRAATPGTLTVERVAALLARYDPNGQARALAYRSYDGTLSIGGGHGGGTLVDVATGELAPGPSGLARLFVTARRLHETLLLDAEWLVVASTVAMLVLAPLGMLMGWPRFANTLWGWHSGTAWALLPLIVLSPLTGLFLAAGITFSGGAGPAAPGQGPGGRGVPLPLPLRLTEAVRTVGAAHDLSGLIWIRPLGGRLAARLSEDGEHRIYAVTREGAAALPRNWPRLWHEGNFAGPWSGLMNVVISLAMLALLVTGPWIWLRRTLRQRRRRRVNRSVPA